MARIVALVDEETGLGFRLAGIDTRPAATPEALERWTESLARDPEVRVVILDEALFGRLPEAVQRRLQESLSPVFVPVPVAAPKASSAGTEEYVARLMRRVIGYRIRVRR